jgi:hypothetical protein
MSEHIPSTSEKLITCWYLWDSDEPGFNHISDGYLPAEPRPRPINKFQKGAWHNRQWEGRPALLIDGVVHELDSPPSAIKWSGV